MGDKSNVENGTDHFFCEDTRLAALTNLGHNILNWPIVKIVVGGKMGEDLTPGQTDSKGTHAPPKHDSQEKLWVH